MAARARKDLGTAEPKCRYQGTNWAEYDRGLVRRGDPTIWFDEETIRGDWTAPPSVGRGKPDLYSRRAIQTCLALKTLLRLRYRATDGLMKSLMRLNGLDFPVPDHAHMSRRAAWLSVKIFHRPRTGAVPVELATADWGESEMLPDLPGTVSQCSADGSLRYRRLPSQHHRTRRQGGGPLRDGAAPRGDDHPRDAILQAIAGGGRDDWKDGRRYPRRSLANNMMFRLRHQCERMFSRACDRQVADAQGRAIILNCFTYLRMRQSVRAGKIGPAASGEEGKGATYAKVSSIMHY